MTVQDDSGAGIGRDAAERGGQLAGAPVVDEAMFAAFYEAQVEGVFSFLARKAGRDDGGEILSQVFEEFFTWWPKNPEHSKPVGTLYQIARCRLNDHFRRSGRVLTVEADDLAKAAARETHRDELAAVVQRVDLGTALAELTEREVQALSLRYLADLPVKDCADVLGVGIDNMKKILKTALRKLRQSSRMDGYETAGTAKEAHR
ncbi:sigma-70 family RNA polymerase sigma factor [Streptomyces sp. NA02950]|uniref:RNA polymerase sigma factor n=1 Tax=Streptomyces sp. NA02950 TaxID=2742137 RepID=UPI001591AB08|nr:sigma-70 family RNA polymerase sigma factor [Streptomyces sp. NA02950]QKV90428.1 sigma-70 family RNA polymerase sigma factor [Streptomyces sp. NA02950]QKV97239.1 sigma-70 family RNA polymerase sigma factor [Streptomyces sp. NA02950]